MNDLQKDEQGMVKTGQYTSVNPNFISQEGLQQAQSFSNVPISSATLASNIKPLAVPQMNQNTIMDAGAAVQGATEGLNTGIQGMISAEDKKIADYQAQVQTQTNKTQSYIDKLLGKGQAQVQAETTAGIPEKTQALTDITNEYNTKALEYRRMEEAVQKESMLTDAQKSARLKEISRIKNTELADIGIKQSVAQNNLTTTQSLIDRKIDLEYGDLKDIIGFQQNFLDNNREDLSKAEQNRLNLLITDNTRKYEEGKSIGEFAKTVAANGADANTISRVANAKTMAEAIQAGGQFAGDILERQIKETQLASERLKLQQLREPGTGGDAPLYNGLSPQTATAVRGIVSGFKSEPQLTNFATIQDGYNFASAIDTKTNNPADDQALVYALAKALDPGSVVREGEYKTALNYSQSWVKAYGKGVEQALLGTGFLSETARENIKKVIETKYKSSKVSYDNIYKQYTGQINNLTGRDDGTKFLRDYAINTNPTGQQTVKSGGQDWIVGQVYNDGKSNWVVDVDGKWTTQ